jgi:two-component system, response regulator PdtaR
MPQYFFDLDNGKTNFIDTIGTELDDPKMVQHEAVGFLASVFKDAAGDQSHSVHLVSVRDHTGRVVFTTALTLQSGWRDADDGVAAVAVRRPVVLVVEDEFLERMSAAEMISESGFDVIEAANADGALAILETRLDVDVIFTDIRMPGSMDGLKLAKLVRRKWPPIKIIATSGDDAIREADLPDGGVFLPKPYTSDRVTAVLRECTGAG